MSFSNLSRRALLAAGLVLAACGPVLAQEQKLKLVVGYQDQTLPTAVAASKVLDGTPYEVEWVTLTGPAAQLAALYSKAIDVGHMGDTSLIIEQGKAKSEWTPQTAPLQIVAGWRSTDLKYPPIVTVARADSGIATLQDLKGRTVANNFGGYNYLHYVLTLLKAGLTENDIQSVRLADQSTSSATFNAGKVEAFSGGTIGVAEAIESGKARILVTSDELDIPALGVFTARTDVLKDPRKKAAIADFLSRLRDYWAWYPSNRAAIEALYVEKLKQTPDRARIVTQFQQARFQPLDEALVKREQRIADVLFEAGVIPRKIDVDLEFSRDFNAVTAPRD
ncbi:ABC transporter substrate-binding protein [Xanthobacter sp. V4C-4]|uniref:ABC transporter substrate-binding protein n=1 Tax=Xanthobacter cornucopiae TaxID=3119924 RepID=UPI0037277257